MEQGIRHGGWKPRAAFDFHVGQRKAVLVHAAEHADQAKRRADPELSDRPQVGDDLRDPALPQPPRLPLAGGGAAAALVQLDPQRGHEIKQRGRLVPDFVHQRGPDAMTDHPLAWDANDRHRVLAAPRKPRSSCLPTATLSSGS